MGRWRRLEQRARLLRVELVALQAKLAVNDYFAVIGEDRLNFLAAEPGQHIFRALLGAAAAKDDGVALQ